MSEIFQNIFSKLSLSIGVGVEEFRRLNSRLNKLDDIKTAIDGITSTNNNTVNVGGGGSSLWHGVVNNESITIANALDFVRGNIIVFVGGVHASGTVAGGQDTSLWAYSTVTLSMDVNGDLIITESAGNQATVSFSFTSLPLLGTGLVGPQGATGATGETGATGVAGADGVTWGSWTNLSYGAGWSDYGGTYYGGQYSVSTDGQVKFRGMVKATTWTAQMVIATLPVDARPAKEVTFIVACNTSGDSCRLRILTTGDLRYEAGGANTSWISLEGFNYSI